MNEQEQVSLFESGWADAHSDHRDPALWSNPFYRGGYLAGATRPFAVGEEGTG